MRQNVGKDKLGRDVWLLLENGKAAYQIDNPNGDVGLEVSRFLKPNGEGGFIEPTTSEIVEVIQSIDSMLGDPEPVATWTAEEIEQAARAHADSLKTVELDRIVAERTRGGTLSADERAAIVGYEKALESLEAEKNRIIEALQSGQSPQALPEWLPAKS